MFYSFVLDREKIINLVGTANPISKDDLTGLLEPMFFIASKLFGFFLEPLNFLLFVGLAGFFLIIVRRTRAGRLMVTFSLVGLLCAAFSPLGPLLMRPLENRFPISPQDTAAPAGIIVLGGALDEDLTIARGSPALGSAAARLTAGVTLARAYPCAKLIFTGGAPNLVVHGSAEAIGVRALWLSLGVSENRLIIEDRSRNTWENATLTRELLNPQSNQTWFLVTSAYHMPRSVGIFRKVGFNIIPYPVDFRTFGNARDFSPTNPVIDKFNMIELAMHEWVGLVAYHLTGKIDNWLPSVAR